MAFDKHANFAKTTVATAPSPASSGTTLTVASGTTFPAAPFNCTVWDGSDITTAEIVRVSSTGSGTNWTIIRAQEGTSARTIIVGDIISCTVTVKDLTDIESAALSVRDFTPVFARYNLNDSRNASVDPGVGKVAFDDNPNNATLMAISNTDADGFDRSTHFNLIGQVGSSRVNATLCWTLIASPDRWFLVWVSGSATNHGAYTSFPVIGIRANGTIVDGDALVMNIQYGDWDAGNYVQATASFAGTNASGTIASGGLSVSVAAATNFSLNGTSSSVTLVGGNNITLTTAASRITISAANSANVVSAIGTAGALSTGSIVLVAGNNITLATGASSITISGPTVPVATNFSLNASSSSVSLVPGSGIGFSTSASTITVSYSGTSNFTGLSFSGNTTTLAGNSATAFSGNSVLVSAMGNLVMSGTTNASGGTISLSASSANVVTSLNGSSGSLSISAGANIGIGQANSTITVSASSYSTLLSITTAAGGASSGTANTASSSAFSIVAGSNITLSQLSTNPALTIIGPNVPSATNFSLNASSSSVSLVAGAGIGFASNLSTITVSVSSAATNFSLNGTSSSVTLIAASNMSLATGASSITISALAATQTLSASGTSVTGTAVSLALVAGNNISLQTATAAGSMTVSVSGIPQTSLTSNLPPRLSYTQNFPLAEAAPVLVGVIASTGTTAASATNNPFGSSLSLQRLFVPAVMSLTEAQLAFGVAFPNTSQGQGSLSQSLFVYSFGNSTSLASVMSASRAVSWASGTTTSGTASSLQQGWSGNNVQPFTFAASSLSAGEYAIAHLLSWAAASTSWTISVYGANAASSNTTSLVTNVATTAASFTAFGADPATISMSFFTSWPGTTQVLAGSGLGSSVLASISAFSSSASAAITAFSGAPATAAALLTASGTSVALTGISGLSASGSGSVLVAISGTSTALTGASALTASGSASVLVAMSGTSTALTGASAFTGSTSAGITAFSAAPTAANVLSSSALAAASGITAIGQFGSAFPALSISGGPFVSANISNAVVLASSSTGTASALISLSSSATAKTVTFGLVYSSTNTGIVSNIGTVAGSIHTASASAAVLSNAGTGGSAFLSSGGLSAGSFFTASSSMGAMSSGGLLAGSFFTASSSMGAMSSSGLLAGSFFTTSASAAAYTGGTGASNFLSTGGLSSGYILTQRPIATALTLSGPASSSATLVINANTGPVIVVSNVNIVTAAATLATSGLPSFGYNGTFAMTTNTTQASYLNGQFDEGIMATGSGPVSIDLKSTAVTATGSLALLNPWFALLGS